MNNYKNSHSTQIRMFSQKFSAGFTLVELIIVIVIIGILAAISIVSYNGWQKKIVETQIKSDLNGVAAAMTNARTFNNVYPSSVPSNFTPSQGVTLIGGSIDGKTYCIDATSSQDASLHYYIDSAHSGSDVQEGDCASAYWLVIGTQTWAKYNLNVGTRIAGATNQTNNGGTNIVEKYCYGDTDAGCTNTDSNGIPYGGLYQWGEAMQYVTTPGAQGICPTGSHIPTDNDWKILEMSLSGMSQATADTEDWRGTDEGTKLKSGGSSGLNMPLAGDRHPNESFYGLSEHADLWSSSEYEYDSTSAWKRSVYSGFTSVHRGTNDKGYGFSVRCLGN